jgi:hypothetical protein
MIRNMSIKSRYKGYTAKIEAPYAQPGRSEESIERDRKTALWGANPKAD